jgi:hypothetical protein
MISVPDEETENLELLINLGKGKKMTTRNIITQTPPWRIPFHIQSLWKESMAYSP